MSEPSAEPSGWRPARRIVGIGFEAFAIALGVYLLLPRIAGFEDVGRSIARGSWIAIILLVAFEAASLVSYGELVRVVLRSMGEEASPGLIQRTTVVGTSLGRTLPGGTTTALAVVVNRLTRAGLDATRSTAALATAGLLSSFVLAVLLVPAVVLAIAGGQDGGIALGATVAAVGIIGVILALLPAAHRPSAVREFVERVLRKVVPRQLWHHVDPVVAARAAEHAVKGVRDLLRNPRALTLGLMLAAANWLFDVAALTAVAVTVGRGTPVTAILLAYVVGQLAAAIPLTPGGVGIVESAMIASFVAAGAPAAAATATVLGWRLFSYWLPVLVGLGVLPTLPRRRRRRGALEPS